MPYGIYDTWYDKAFPQYDKGENPIIVECESCGRDIKIDLDYLDDSQVNDVPHGDGETLRICNLCYDSWVNGPAFKEEFKKICAVMNADILRELRR